MGAIQSVSASVLAVCFVLGLAGCSKSGDVGREPGNGSEAAGSGAMGDDKVDAAKAGGSEDDVAVADVKLFPLGFDYSERRSGYTKWGYIDRTGKMVFEVPFAEAQAVHEGRALVRDRDGKYGVIDESGRVIIEPRYHLAKDYAEGLAAVIVSGNLVDDNAQWGYVDRSGQLTIPGPFLEAKPFSEGLACVLVAQGEDLDDARWGFIDKSGKMVIAPQYSVAGPFSDGLAAVASGREDLGYIDHEGTLVIDNQGALIDTVALGVAQFSEGLAVVLKEGKTKDDWPKFGYVDKKGVLAVEAKFGVAGPFSGGLAAATLSRLGNRKADYGYIDQTGQWAIPAHYRVAGNFAEGRAAVQVAGVFPNLKEMRFSYIDRSGKRITADEFAFVEPFRGGLARVESEVNGKRYMGYIDRQGRYVVDPWTAAGVPEGDPRRAPQRPSVEAGTDSAVHNVPEQSYAKAMAKAKTAECIENLRSLGTSVRAEISTRMPGKEYEPITLDLLLKTGYIRPSSLKCRHGKSDRKCDYYFFWSRGQREDPERLVACDLDPHAEDGNSRGVLYADGHVEAMTPEEFEKELAKPVNQTFAEAFRKAGGK